MLFVQVILLFLIAGMPVSLWVYSIYARLHIYVGADFFLEIFLQSLISPLFALPVTAI